MLTVSGGERMFVKLVRSQGHERKTNGRDRSDHVNRKGRKAASVIVRQGAGVVLRGGMQPDACHVGLQIPRLLDCEGEREAPEPFTDRLWQQTETLDFDLRA